MDGEDDLLEGETLPLDDEEFYASTPSVEEWEEVFVAPPSPSAAAAAAAAAAGSNSDDQDDPLSLSTEQAGQNHSALPKEAITLTFTREELFGRKPETEAEKKARIELRKEISREQKRVQLALHKLHLLCLNAALVFRNRVCNESVLHAIMLSHLPVSIASMKASAEPAFMRGLVRWFSSVFQPRRPSETQAPAPARSGSQDNPMQLDSSSSSSEDEEAGDSGGPAAASNDGSDQISRTAADLAASSSSANMRDKTQLRNLLECALELAGTAEDAAALMVAQCRGLGLTARLVVLLQPEPSMREINRIGVEAMLASAPRTKRAKSTNASDPLVIEDDEQDSTSTAAAAATAASSSSSAGDRSRGVGFTAKETVSAWCEVFSSAQRRWVYANGLTCGVDSPQEVEEAYGAPVQYVVGIDDSGYVADVTERYAHKGLAETYKYRVKEKWWRQTIAPFRNPDDEAVREEKADLEGAQMAVSLPSALGAYKGHKLYALERFLLKHEVIHPRGPILGYCKGEPVFRRDCVQPLKTRDAWVREGRSVRTGEVCAKTVTKGAAKAGADKSKDGKQTGGKGERTMTMMKKKKEKVPSSKGKSSKGKAAKKGASLGRSNSSRRSSLGDGGEYGEEDEEEEEEDEEEDGSCGDVLSAAGHNDALFDAGEDDGDGSTSADGSVELFGHWQTEPYRRAVATNGRVPVNAHGNVDLYRPEMLPVNTVHLREAGMAGLARELQIDYADAVTGFDHSSGRAFPVKDGVVVCAEYAQLLREVWLQKQTVIVDKAAEDRAERVLLRWERLVSQLLLHRSLKEKYFSKKT